MELKTKNVIHHIPEGRGLLTGHDKLSIIIPSAGEQFLQKTVDDILEKATEEIEIIVFFDGYQHDPPLKDDHRLKIIYSPERVGLRNAIHAGVEASDSKYIMKIDGHCILDKGFDEKLKADCKDNWLVIPRRYDLEYEKWERGNKITDYMYITPPLENPIVEKGHWPSQGFDPSRCHSKHSTELIDGTMTFQGSCWFMNRKYYEDIDGIDHNVYWLESLNLGNKVWLSGGMVIVNKKTWYAHLHKGRKLGRGFHVNSHKVYIDKKYAIDLWMNNRWKKQTKDFKWLVDKFSPKGWENVDWTKEWKV